MKKIKPKFILKMFNKEEEYFSNIAKKSSYKSII